MSPQSMRVLVIGSGSREHAIAQTLSKSPRVQKIWVAPGNAGNALDPKCENVTIPVSDIQALVEFAQTHKVDLTVVGPEAPLVAGIVDQFRAANLSIVGPDRFAAQLEGSKSHSKAVMQACGLPTSAFKTFSDTETAIQFATSQHFPLVIKADGLASGKGVIIAQNPDEARDAIYALWALQTSLPGENQSPLIVIEEFVSGIERSVIALVSGEQFILLPTAQDYKRRFEEDKGPNTGGMGAVCPAPLPLSMEETIKERVFKPILKYLAEQGHPFCGFLYAGLMIKPDWSDFSVLEFNVRLGDPETQVILPRLQSDFYTLLEATAQFQLDPTQTLAWDPRPAVGIVLSGAHYPEHALKPTPLSGPLQTDPQRSVYVFHAGTSQDSQGFKAQGGRLLTVTALGQTQHQARATALEHLQKIQCDGTSFRSDIAVN